MSASETNARTNESSLPEKSLSAHSAVKEAMVAPGTTKGSVIEKLFTVPLQVPREIRIIVEQTAISALFILSDMLIVWLVGLAFADTMKEIPVVGYVYDGVKIASVLVITIRYLLACIVDMNRSRKELLSELKTPEPGRGVER